MSLSLLDIHGPSITIDTACSSGLIAFDQAVQYLQSGEGESAIVCGANTHAWYAVLPLVANDRDRRLITPSFPGLVLLASSQLRR